MKSAKGKNPNPLFSAFEQLQMQNHSEVKLNKVVLPKANTYDITTHERERPSDCFKTWIFTP